ncbi:MAG: tetratricopeptide repeat protein [Lacunisphaera sp.]|nr:tetratricopeptide repeat protein [Lacunisphaera sp.]
MKATFVIGFTLAMLAPALKAEETATSEAYRLGALARLAEMDGKQSEVLDYFNQSLAFVPDAIIYSNRGDLKNKLRDFSGAIADYDKAIALQPADIEIFYGNRGFYKHQMGDLAGAIADYDQVIARKPHAALYYNNRGYAKITKGDLAGAIADYSKALALEPDTIKFRDNLANAKRDSGDLAGAIAEYDKLVELEPKEPRFYYVRAYSRRLINDFAGAIDDYTKFYELFPDNWLGCFCRAILRHAKGELEAAATDYDLTLAVAKKEDYSYIWPYREIALRQLQRGTLFAELAKTVAQWKDSWSKTLGLYLLEAIPEAGLFAKAGQGPANLVPAQQCAAFYFCRYYPAARGRRGRRPEIFRAMRRHETDHLRRVHPRPRGRRAPLEKALNCGPPEKVLLENVGGGP